MTFTGLASHGETGRRMSPPGTNWCLLIYSARHNDLAHRHHRIHAARIGDFARFIEDPGEALVIVKRRVNSLLSSWVTE
jgi:hypothetical protein